MNLNDYLVKKNEINYIFLEYLFKELSSTEDEKLKIINSKRKHFKINIDENNKNSYENKLIEHNYYPIINRNLEDIIDMGNIDWREKYYVNCFNYNSGKDFEIKKICHNYIEGLHWNLLYYFDKCASWKIGRAHV